MEKNPSKLKYLVLLLIVVILIYVLYFREKQIATDTIANANTQNFVTVENWGLQKVQVYNPITTKETPLGMQFRGIPVSGESIRNGMIRYEIYKTVNNNGVSIEKLGELNARVTGRALPTYMKDHLSKYKTNWSEIVKAAKRGSDNAALWARALQAEQVIAAARLNS